MRLSGVNEYNLKAPGWPGGRARQLVPSPWQQAAGEHTQNTERGCTCNTEICTLGFVQSHARLLRLIPFLIFIQCVPSRCAAVSLSFAWFEVSIVWIRRGAVWIKLHVLKRLKKETMKIWKVQKFSESFTCGNVTPTHAQCSLSYMYISSAMWLCSTMIFVWKKLIFELHNKKEEMQLSLSYVSGANTEK